MAMTGVPKLRRDQLTPLPRVTVPDQSFWWGPSHAMMHTGQDAIFATIEHLLSQPPQLIAADIETPGTGTARWTMTCITLAFTDAGGGYHSVLLDPCRDPRHGVLVADAFAHASHIVFHNSSFDVPVLFAHGLLRDDQFVKILDTLVVARMVRTWMPAGRRLEDLCTRYKIVADSNATIATLFTAAGHKTQNAGYAHTDISTPTYRVGAMNDTLATLRLWPVIVGDARAQITGNVPGASPSAKLTPDEAGQLIADISRYNQITLRAAAYGLNVDPDYARDWSASQEQAVDTARRTIAAVGLEPGVGAHLIAYLHSRKELPEDWDTTDKGALKADKAAMERLSLIGHPLSQAHTVIAEHAKNQNYIDTILADAQVTGRVHPSIGVLGAAASGRMSVTGPALQQFSAAARPVIASDGEPWWSVDWSSIEPVVMANCAGDADFIAPFNAGHDLYVPVAKRAGLIPADLPDDQAVKHPGRKKAKVVLLASMYGQGNKSLAAAQGWSVDEAYAFKSKLRASMIPSFEFMSTIKAESEQTQRIATISGRVLDELSPAGEPRSYGSFNHFCIAPDTPVLTADLRHVRADSVRPGDELVGFDEHSPEPSGRGGGKRRYRTAVVRNVNMVHKPSVAVYTADGKVTVCSADHRWFVRVPGRQPRLAWVQAADLTTSHQMMSVGTWEVADSRDGGYLAGLFDGEGSMQTRASGSTCTQLTFHQKPGNGVMGEFRAAMDRLGLTYTFSPRHPSSTSPCDGIRVSGVARMMRTVGMVRPHRMLTRAKDIFDGASLFGNVSVADTPHITKVEPVGTHTVVAIETSTHTFIANGYLSHNCQGSAADILMYATLALDKMGAADGLRLWIHDELVVTEEYVEAVREAMRTPPPQLIRYAAVHGMVPKLLIDSQPLGTRWQKV